MQEHVLLTPRDVDDDTKEFPVINRMEEKNPWGTHSTDPIKDIKERPMTLLAPQRSEILDSQKGNRWEQKAKPVSNSAPRFGMGELI